jgi:hypothetical protein
MNIDARAGAAVYSSTLHFYDWFVLGFSNTFAWQCPTSKILSFYNQNISNQHLDIGVGTGYYLDKCKFPSSQPAITLLDLNSNCLDFTFHRIQRYQPKAYEANVLAPLNLGNSKFDSVALNYLLHCLPGSISTKGIVFQHLKPYLNKDAVVFGTTILGRGVPHNFIGRMLMKKYNATGVFSNREDDFEMLERILKEHFRDFSLHILGCVAFFKGHF